MIFRQQLFRISNTVSVQSKFFAIAHDDFAEAQLLHVSAVKDRLDGGSEEGRVILYLREQIDSGVATFTVRPSFRVTMTFRPSSSA